MLHEPNDGERFRSSATNNHSIPLSSGGKLPSSRLQCRFPIQFAGLLQRMQAFSLLIFDIDDLIPCSFAKSSKSGDVP